MVTDVMSIRKKIAVMSIALFLLMFCYSFLNVITTHDILILTDGRILEKEAGSIKEPYGKNIDRIIKGRLLYVPGWFSLTSYYFNQYSLIDLNKKLINENGFLYYLSFLFLFAPLFLLIRFSKPDKARNEIQPPVKEETGKAVLKNDTDNKSKEDVVGIFLKLFVHQSGAPDTAMSQFRLVSKNFSETLFTYELMINNSGIHRFNKRVNAKWLKRRMSIGELGEDTSSKSKCFYVIYDNHIVVKIPPRKIKDFDDYIKRIYKEQVLIDKLAPRECITPGVSIILSKIPRFSKEIQHYPRSQKELRCVSILRKMPIYQSYLKMNGSFVFFMDLSQYYFLGYYIKEAHNTRERFFNEIVMHDTILWEAAEFTARYGQQYHIIYDEIRALYHKLETDVRSVISRNNHEFSISNNKLRTLFLYYLAGNKIPADEIDVNKTLLVQLEYLIKSLIKNNQSLISSYRDMINTYIKTSFLRTNKPRFENIITNLLELLSLMRKKQVSMRDLKPDNLLIVGNKEEYPNFLSKIDSFKIGLIDLETAVDLKPEKKKIVQPQLGGTPVYSTPSHLYNNKMIKETYGHLSHILHIQDWYAVIAIIYKLIVNEHLFGQTAKLMPAIYEKMVSPLKENQTKDELVKETSRLFWRSSIIEFDRNLGMKKELMKSTKVLIPPPGAKMFGIYVSKEKEWVTKNIKSIISKQTVYSDEKTISLLYEGSVEDITDLRSKVKVGLGFKFSQDKKKSAMKMLQKLELMKLKLKHLSYLERLMLSEFPEISAHKLLTFMFNIVFKFMYLKKWGILTEFTELKNKKNANNNLDMTLTKLFDE